MVSVVIHSNPHLANQIESAEWLRRGFAKHGIRARVTADKYEPADVHVVQGPWYCLNYWQPRSADCPVLRLDRGFWGHARFDLSVGWLRPDGSRDYLYGDKTEPNGEIPELKPEKSGKRSAVVFADYGRDMAVDVAEARQRYDAVYFRPHPAEPKSVPLAMSLNCDLANVWQVGDVAIGHSSTVLVKARINGLAVESTDPRHVVQDCNGSRERWLKQVSWAQWNHEQIQAGDFWEHLSDYSRRSMH